MQIDAHLVNFMANFICLIRMTKAQVRQKQNRGKISLKSQVRNNMLPFLQRENEASNASAWIHVMKHGLDTIKKMAQRKGLNISADTSEP